MTETFEMSRPTNSPDMTSAISSPALEVGLMLSELLGGVTRPFGPDRALASLSPRQAHEKGLMTKDTFGRIGDGSSISVDLQSSLANRLRARMGADGSPEYVLTWKEWPIEQGPPICALRARAPRTSDKGCGGSRSGTASEPKAMQAGWPTPMAGTPAQNGNNPAGNTDASRKTVALVSGWPSPKASNTTGPGTRGEGGENLQTVAGWATPRTADAEKNVRSPEGALREAKRKGAQNDLGVTSQLAGWATPTTRDHKDGSAEGTAPVNGLLGRQVWGLGPTPNGSPASTEKRGALNPNFSRWLMGYPTVWGRCAVTVTRSSRKSRRNSS